MDYGAIGEFMPDEVAGWCFSIADDGLYLFEAYSPAGEDLVIEDYCTSPETALNEMKADIVRVYENYDVDEHVDGWAQMRGTRGVPSTYRELLEDAEAIEKMLEELSIAVSQLELQA